MSMARLTTTRFEMTYGVDWQPQQLFVEAAIGNESIGIGTTFGVTTAVSDMTQGARRGRVAKPIRGTGAARIPSVVQA